MKLKDTAMPAKQKSYIRKQRFSESLFKHLMRVTNFKAYILTGRINDCSSLNCFQGPEALSSLAGPVQPPMKSPPTSCQELWIPFHLSLQLSFPGPELPDILGWSYIPDVLLSGGVVGMRPASPQQSPVLPLLSQLWTRMYGWTPTALGFRLFLIERCSGNRLQ